MTTKKPDSPTFTISQWQQAIESDDVDAVRELIKEPFVRPSCMRKYRKDGTWFLLDPLCESARRNCIPIAKLILENGRDPNKTYGMEHWNETWPNAFCLAWASSDEMHTLLIEHGADPKTIEGIEIPYLKETTVPFDETTDDLGEQWVAAIESRDKDRIESLLTDHPQLVDQPLYDRQDALFTVAGTGDVEIAKLLVSFGYDSRRVQIATEMATPEVAEVLLSTGIEGKPRMYLLAYTARHREIKFWTDRGQSPKGLLHDACCGRAGFRGHFQDKRDASSREKFCETVRCLITAGADVNERNAGGNNKWEGCKPWVSNRETPLHYAAGSWDIDVIQQLINAGADKTLTNDLGDAPFDWAIRYGAPYDVVQLLDFEGNPRRNPDLVWAANQGDLAKVKQMIEAGADPNSVDENGMGTLLNFHPEVTKYLLEQGANPDTQRNENVLPVLVGVTGFNTECVKLMLDAGANPDQQSEYNGEAALHHAVCGSDVELVKALLDAGADPNKGTKNWRATYMLWRDARTRNETPLHRAAAFGNQEIINLLIDAGADPTKQDVHKDTPLSWASWHMREKSVIDLLYYEGSGVGPDLVRGGEGVVDPAIHTANCKSNLPRNDELVGASIGGELEKVMQLVEGGADPNSCDGNGMGTLLGFSPEITKYLIEKGANADLQKNENIMPILPAMTCDFECFKLILGSGANANIASAHNGETALHFAATGDNLEMVQLLLKAGADPNANTIPGRLTYYLWRDARVRGETPLHRAAAWGTQQVIQELLDAGADPTLRDANKDTPLSYASWHQRDGDIIAQLAYEGSGIGPDFD